MGLGHGWTSGGGAGSISGQAITPASVTATGAVQGATVVSTSSVTGTYIAATDSSLGYYMGGSNLISRDANTGTWVITSSEDASAITATRPAWGIKSVRNLNAQTLIFGLADSGSTNYVFTVAKEGTLATDFTDDSANTGNRTVNKPSGISSFAAGSGSITITNSCCIASTSRVFAVLQTNDATATSIQSVIPSAGSFIIKANANATGTTKVAWFVVN